MKKILLLISLLAIFCGGCYHSIRESLICTRLALPDTLRVQGLGHYNDQVIDVDWLDNELAPDSVEAFIRYIVPDYYSSFVEVNPQRRAFVASGVIEQSLKKWEQYQKEYSNNYRIAYYHKAWFFKGSTAGIVILRGCVIVGDIHFPEPKAWLGEHQR